MDTSKVTSKIVRNGDVSIEVLSQGTGPVIVILPSLGRGAEDYDDVAAGVAANGFRILRPQPRGIGASKGTLTNITLHDLAADIAHVVEAEGAGPVVIAGHAFGNFVARMLAAVGLISCAAWHCSQPPRAGFRPVNRLTTRRCRDSIYKSGDLSLSEEERIGHLRRAFFAPGNDPRGLADRMASASQARTVGCTACGPGTGMVLGRARAGARFAGL